MPLRISREGGTTFRRSRIVKMYSPAMGGKDADRDPITVNAKGRPSGDALEGREVWKAQLRCLFTSLVMSNMRDLALAAEDRTELLVGVDVAAVLGVLQAVPLDVGPELLGHFGARQRARPDHGGECGAGRIGFMNAALGVRFLPGLLGGLLPRSGLLGGLPGALLGGLLRCLLLGGHRVSPSVCEDHACRVTAELP